MGFYAPDVLITDARRHGIAVLGPDINASLATCSLEAAPGSDRLTLSHAIRMGLSYVHELGPVQQELIVQRRDRPFRSLRDFCHRTRLPRRVIENLIRSGAMDSLGRSRRELLWELGGLSYREQELDLEVPLPEVDLPALGTFERMLWEYELLGMSTGEHIVGMYRDRLREKGVLSSGDLLARRSEEMVCVAGKVIVRQRPPTAKGHVFITLEDEEGLINLIVRPHTYERYKTVLRNPALLIVQGILQKEGQAVSVLVHAASSFFRPR